MNILCYLLPYSAEETLVIELNVRVMDQPTEKINEVSDSQGAQPESQWITNGVCIAVSMAVFIPQNPNPETEWLCLICTCDSKVTLLGAFFLN